MKTASFVTLGGSFCFFLLRFPQLRKRLCSSRCRFYQDYFLSSMRQANNGFRVIQGGHGIGVWGEAWVK